MLRALCEDVARLHDVSVTTMLDRRCDLSLPDAVRVVTTDRLDRHETQFKSLAAAADVAVIIAPELDDMLTERVALARDAGADVVAPPEDVIRLCSDKLRLAQFLVEHEIPTIPTSSVNDASEIALDDKVVIKPRFGAGSHDVVTVDFDSVGAYATPHSEPTTSQRIVQPFVPGDSYSVGALCRSSVEDPAASVDVLPVACQELSADGRFHYRAGTAPARPAAAENMFKTVNACLSLLPRSAGYVGFDYVVPFDAPEDPLLVEINPRLCTSYLGYRALTEENLAGRMLGVGTRSSLAWEPRSVTFFPNGDVRVRDQRVEPCM